MTELLVKAGDLTETVDAGILRFPFARRWWNWHTRGSQKPVPKGMRVQLPPSAFFLPQLKRKRSWQVSQ